MIKTVFMFVLAFTLHLQAIIIEAPHFSDLVDHVKPHSLVILDIDDTLLVPTQTLGSDVWFCHRLKIHRSQENSHSKALDKALAEWEGVRHLTKMKIVEEGSDVIVRDLQAQNITVMGLTTQGLALATRTVTQLRDVGIDLRKTAPEKDDYYFINDHGNLYRRGILFTAGSPKGPALIKLLNHWNLKPDHIIFINDKESHLKDVEKSVEEAGIAFTGLRYSYSDERVNGFNPKLADIQWELSTFGNIISDEEASKYLPK